MSRKRRQEPREILPDPKFNEIIIAKTMNVMMRSGKKSVAERAMYGALDQIAKKAGGDPVELFKKAIANVKPVVEVRSRRVGGANYQVPTEVRPERAQSLALRWLLEAANSRSERTIADRLANEVLDAAQNRGVAIKKREDTHRMADANKAFAHFRW